MNPELLQAILPQLREVTLRKDGRHKAWCPFHADGQDGCIALCPFRRDEHTPNPRFGARGLCQSKGGGKG